MTKTPVTYKETLDGILEIHEIERVVMDNLVRAQKYLFRNYKKLPMGELYLLQNHFPIIPFRAIARVDFVKAVKHATVTGDLTLLKQFIKEQMQK